MPAKGRVTVANLIKLFFAGGILFNAIPHLVQGICGKHHMTPFSVKSSPTTNIIWGWTNLIFGGWLLNCQNCNFLAGSSLMAFCLGGFVTSLFLSIFWSNPNARLPWHKP
jgi:hypothetical protein